MKKKLIFIVLLSLFFVMDATAGSIRVTLLNPGGEHWFWKMTINFMQAAAEDLDIELEVVSSKFNYGTILQAEKITNRNNPPDYIITGNEKSSAGRIIRIADRAGIKIFLFNNDFVDPRDIKKYGQPREKYKHWIGKLIPNNYSAGYQIGEILINEASQKGLIAKDGKVYIAAISGFLKTHASTERVRGLKKIVEDYRDKAKLLHIVSGDWSEKRAEKISVGLFRRYKEINAFWGVNDSTALGAIKHAISIGKIPGKDIVFGGCGWYAPAIQKVKKGVLATTVGGHFMDAGWAMVLIHDYHHGKDFINEPLKTTMHSIDKSNVDKLKHVFGKQEWEKIDFKKFSKIHNPDLKKYNFNLKAVLQQF
ncbi:MAG: substrate-binding domain-containing protein [Deltaproteobacteria bacterium]|nr:substrate-binding domain-containing protein [Deltaproteobacteria bacterium]